MKSERVNKFQNCITFRTGFDTKYVVLNDEDTGLISYIGKYPKKEKEPNYSNFKEESIQR